jgi:hypothetical protein
MIDSATDQPASLLTEYILSVLAPLLLAGSISDLRLARLAAMEAIATYTARSQEELMTIAQIAGLAIAALDNLRLSAAPELSVSLKLKLRGNAAALNRAARGNTADLRMLRRDSTASSDEECARQAAMQALDEARMAIRQAEAEPAASSPAPEPAAPDPMPERAAPSPTAEPANGRRRTMWTGAWASAMTDVAAEFSRGLDRLPPTQRRAEIMRIGVLSETARRISQTGDQAAPRKSDLLSSTSMSGDRIRHPHSTGDLPAKG